MNVVDLYAYPQYVLIGAIIAGLVLAALNPRWLFFAVIGALVAADARGYVYSRFEATGSYFNIFDLLLVFGLLSAFLRGRKDTVGVPVLWYLILVDLIVGYLLSFAKMGFNYDVLRTTRWAFFLPMLWFISDTCIRTREDARIVLYIVVAGCCVQSARQCIYVAFFDELQTNTTAWRTIRYLNAGSVIVPLCFLLVPLNRSKLFTLFLYISSSICVAALILTQTRSMWIPQLILIVVGGWVLARRKLLGILLPSAAGLLILSVAFSIFAPNKVDLSDVFLHGRMNDFSSGNGREAGIYYEINAWLDGNIILGEGLAFNYAHTYANLDDVAWGHNGYTSYLSNLGIIGFMLFAVALPILGLSKARILWNSKDNDLKLYGLLTGCMVWYFILESALTSGLLTGLPYFLNVILLGGAGSLAARAASPATEETESNETEQPQLA